MTLLLTVLSAACTGRALGLNLAGRFFERRDKRRLMRRLDALLVAHKLGGA
jgi:hypothetical protein